jgi:hypothetical protein
MTLITMILAYILAVIVFNYISKAFFYILAVIACIAICNVAIDVSQPKISNG